MEASNCNLTNIPLDGTESLKKKKNKTPPPPPKKTSNKTTGWLLFKTHKQMDDEPGALMDHYCCSSGILRKCTISPRNPTSGNSLQIYMSCVWF